MAQHNSILFEPVKVTIHKVEEYKQLGGKFQFSSDHYNHTKLSKCFSGSVANLLKTLRARHYFAS